MISRAEIVFPVNIDPFGLAKWMYCTAAENSALLLSEEAINLKANRTEDRGDVRVMGIDNLNANQRREGCTGGRQRDCGRGSVSSNIFAGVM